MTAKSAIVLAGPRWQRITIEIICFLLAALFLYTGIHKLTDNVAFSSVLHKSPFVSQYADVLAKLVPYTELALVLLLFIDRFRFWALEAAFALMLMFTLYVLAMLVFAVDLPCSCGGIISELGWREHVLVNSIFTALALWGSYLQYKQPPKVKVEKTATQDVSPAIVKPAMLLLAVLGGSMLSSAQSARDVFTVYVNEYGVEVPRQYVDEHCTGGNLLCVIEYKETVPVAIYYRI